MYALATFVNNEVRYLTLNSFGCKLTKKAVTTFQTIEGAQKVQEHYQKPNPHNPEAHKPFQNSKVVALSL